MKNLFVFFLIMAGLLTLVISCEKDEGTVWENNALKATTTASSTYYGYSPSFVNDNDLSTDVGDGWVNDAGTSLPQWVQLTFSESKKISRVVIYTSAGYEIQDYQIQYLDGADWKTAATVTGNTKTVITSLFNEIESNQVRVYATKGSTSQPTYARVNEFQVWSN